MQFIQNNKDILSPLGFFVLLSLVASLLFGFTHTPTWQDASQYSAYATHLSSGQGYSLDGVSFSNLREPGYPLFLALVYGLFGNENIFMVTLVQAFLLSLVAWVFFLIMKGIGYVRPGLILGAMIILFPSYGYYTHEVGSEILFMFCVALLFSLSFLVLKKEKEGGVDPGWYLLLGGVIGYGTLVRVQLLFLLPIMGLIVLLFFRRYVPWKGVVLTFVSFGILIGSWSLVCFKYTGSFALTTGRQELILHARAVRAELSYKELGQYFIAWIHKRVSLEYIDPMLQRADLVGIISAYTASATTPEVIAQIKQQDLRIIASRPMHYLAGNFIEVGKLYYIEYLYTPYLSKFVRAGMYTLLYLWTIFGIWALYAFRKHMKKEILELCVLVTILVSYNAFILSFFDTIPRYNTPFLVFFLMIGMLGVLVYKEGKATLREGSSVVMMSK